MKQLLNHLCSIDGSANLQWLRDYQQQLEKLTTNPLSFSGIAAATFFTLDFAPEQAEIAYLILRLPGAAAHALEQEKLGFSRYPFFGKGLKLTNDPGPILSND